MKFLNVLLVATSVIARSSDGYCYYRPSDIDLIEAAVKGTASGAIGIVGGAVGGLIGVAKGVVVGGIALTASAVVQADAIIHKSCAYGTFYGESCWRCVDALPLIADLNIEAKIQASVTAGATIN
ncbi:hypothetical protein CONCODRAFT_13743 [Conidiobolus coronatus NRRL 28638]|uniref:Uncharacterized protein n=1 Tax=Conidiobolus coronatus (strain ATCC 28846 / CBS 209.66 / NRRL 28638) TaxID=796925 RepID=A0A137NQ65_CONC2|nr:hypothetical protein CONCODRAFT_13743 [Conidiobolus coronatus NRRL 28638]|eukprot:KXN64886.1 hypothetical protein CONCODRAFT_13743 [Conidiobolus coronatus NRRL 28638]